MTAEHHPSEEHVHDWEVSSGWGVICGVSKCKLCGKVARDSDFLSAVELQALAEDEKS